LSLGGSLSKLCLTALPSIPTYDWHQVMAKAHMAFGQVSYKWKIIKITSHKWTCRWWIHFPLFIL
jgi:hypothetical protein